MNCRTMETVIWPPLLNSRLAPRACVEGPAAGFRARAHCYEGRRCQCRLSNAVGPAAGPPAAAFPSVAALCLELRADQILEREHFVPLGLRQQFALFHDDVVQALAGQI